VWLVPDKWRLIYGHRTASISKMALLYGARKEIERVKRTRREKNTLSRQQSFGGVLLAEVAVAVLLDGDGVVFGLMAKTKFADRPAEFIAGLRNRMRPIQ